MRWKKSMFLVRYEDQNHLKIYSRREVFSMLIEDILGRFNLKVQSTLPVANSFSSEVYRLLLDDGQTVYCKLPFTKEKWHREFKCLNHLLDSVNVPKIINFIEPTETFNGVFLLTALEGHSITTLTPELAKEVGELHAKLHEISYEFYGSYTNEGFEVLPENDWRLFILSTLERFVPFVRQTLSEELYKHPTIGFKSYLNAYQHQNHLRLSIWIFV